MSRFLVRTSVKTAAVATVTAAVLFAAPAAFADTADVTVGVTPGSFSAATAVTSGLAPVVSSHEGSTSSAALELTVDNSTGTLAGWSVSQVVSDFAYSGSNGGSAIDAGNFTVVPGLASGTKAGALTVGGGASLKTPQIVLSAPADTDTIGVSTLPLEATLTVPADSRVGTYSATLTTTVAAAPTAP